MAFSKPTIPSRRPQKLRLFVSHGWTPRTAKTNQSDVSGRTSGAQIIITLPTTTMHRSPLRAEIFLQEFEGAIAKAFESMAEKAVSRLLQARFYIRGCESLPSTRDTVLG
ncbi:uncharacterized protein ATNIH1004_010821 [Aspergillus tanneri]|uniref:Uncharacterized protein n=1 Tax=Aspergillus tanneri TaxID=1220188 RepID=A0A5M9M4F4_9EURO|nr:uncharacterized protein ATNIH1004_010821 [Aspergillus tanneri]KAA8641882.1 hypothetical protein ATNIH1004_010821 [Aspergillus tanneri]